MGEQWAELSGDKRQQFAEQIFQEMQEGYYQSSMAFCQELSKELEGSIQTLDISVRQKKLYD